MKMDKKMQECFKPHAMMHSLFGLGLGIVVVALWPSFGVLWLGVALMVTAVILDWMRK